MSGRNLVDEMRSGSRPLVERPPRSLFDIAVAAIAVMAVGALGVVAYGAFFPAQAPRPVVVAGAPVVSWTEADAAACDAKGAAAADSPDTGSYLITNRSVSEGVAFLTTKVKCLLTARAERFCADEGKGQLVALINDYFNRMDLVKLGVAAQGAPMAMMGGLMGGEVAAGDAVYSGMAEDTYKYMAEHNGEVVTAIRKLGAGGVIEAAAFRPLPFAGIPKGIEDVFAGVTPTSNICG